MGPLPSKWAEDNTLITYSSRKWAENSRKQEHWPKNIIHCMSETERNNYQERILLAYKRKQFIFLRMFGRTKFVLKSRHWIKNAFTIQ